MSNASALWNDFNESMKEEEQTPEENPETPENPVDENINEGF